MDWFFKTQIIAGWLPNTVLALTVIGLAAVVILRSKKGWIRPLLVQIGIGLIGFAVGGLVVWLLSDVFKVFGVSLGWVVMTTIAIGLGVATALVAAIVQSKGARRAVAAVTIVFALIYCGISVDRIYGEYTTVGSLFGVPQFSKLDESTVRHASMSVDQWRKLAKRGRLPSMPRKGEVHSVRIDATTSGFGARTANVYLPPAALSKTPPALPVMVVLAGQPGSPDRYFSAGQLGVMLNAYAAKHDGLAPIAVSPDQNGALVHNTLCSDTKVYGNAETYLTRDVTSWVKRTLPVARSADQWLIGGFSQGGTCATQLGAAYPSIYGHIFSAGGEIEPTDGGHRKTVDRFFDGKEKEFDKHVPINIIKAHAPSTQTWFSAAGQWDGKSQKNQAAISKAAMDAGMSTTTVVVRSTGHDWHTVQAGMEAQIDMFGTETGLGRTHKSIGDYPRLEVIAANTNNEND